MNKVTGMLDLMPDILEGATIVHVYGDENVLLENYRSIIEYSQNQIRVQGKNLKLCIFGEDLVIDRFTRDDCRIFGKIHKIEYIPM